MSWSVVELLERAETQGSLMVPLRYGKRPLRSIFRYERSVRTLDCHGMSCSEAVKFISGFISWAKSNLSRKGGRDKKLVQVVTGKGNHSRSKVPVIRGKAIRLLQDFRLKYEEVNSGGSLIVYFWPDIRGRSERPLTTETFNTTSSPTNVMTFVYYIFNRHLKKKKIDQPFILG